MANELLSYDETKQILTKITIDVDEQDNFVFVLDTNPIVALNQMALDSDDGSKTSSGVSQTDNITTQVKQPEIGEVADEQ